MKNNNLYEIWVSYKTIFIGVSFTKLQENVTKFLGIHSKIRVIKLNEGVFFVILS